MSDESFRTLHALRIKGFAKADLVAEVAGVEHSIAERHLAELHQDGHVQFREARGLWQLTPEGRAAHAQALAAQVESLDIPALGERYEPFLEINEQLKALCGDWQLRDGAPNDHTDVGYDEAVIDRLVALNDQAQAVVEKLGQVWPRLASYGPRLAQTCQMVADGEMKMFTGVMCGSFHDVWMELHEDLILAQGIDRAEEGSF